MTVHSCSSNFLELFCNDFGQYWMQQWSYYAFSVIEIVVFTVSYGCSIFWRETGLLIYFLLIFFLWNKTSHERKIHSLIREAIQDALFFEETRKRIFCNIRSEAIPFSFGVPKNSYMKRDIRDVSGLASTLVLISEWSEVNKGGNNSTEYFSGKDMRKRSRMFAWYPLYWRYKCAYPFRL